MRLLIDTDAFWKLAVAELIDDAVGVFDARLSECGRLPALPHMLRRGRLRRFIGAATCDSLVSIANAVPAISQPCNEWLDRLTSIEAVDAGEAQIFAAAAETSLGVITGDKRALRAVKDVRGFAEAIEGRIVVIEAILLCLCQQLGAMDVRRRVQVLAEKDTMIQVCFSAGNSNPEEALLSYYQELAAGLDPLVLWSPQLGGGT